MHSAFRIWCLVALITIPSHVYAGAWTQDKGNGQVIVTGSYYTSDKRIDNSGNKQSQPTYSQYVINPYLEYGLSDGITVGTNLNFQRTNQSSQSNRGVGDSEFFLRARLMQAGGFVLAAEPMIKLPGIDGDNDSPKIGSDDADAGLGLSAGYGWQGHFVNVDAQYRHRLGDPKDQINLAATAGYSLTPRWMILPQAFLTLRTDSPTSASFTQSSGDDYNLFKLQLSAVYKLTDTASLQFGAFSHIDGKNTGTGNGVLIGVWKKF